MKNKEPQIILSVHHGSVTTAWIEILHWMHKRIKNEETKILSQEAVQLQEESEIWRNVKEEW